MFEPVRAVEAVLPGHRIGEAVLPFTKAGHGDSEAVDLGANLSG